MIIREALDTVRKLNEEISEKNEKLESLFERQDIYPIELSREEYKWWVYDHSWDYPSRDGVKEIIAMVDVLRKAHPNLMSYGKLVRNLENEYGEKIHAKALGERISRRIAGWFVNGEIMPFKIYKVDKYGEKYIGNHKFGLR